MDPINWKEILQIFLNLPLPVMLVVSGILIFALGAGLKIPLGGGKFLAITGRESRKWGAMAGGMLLVLSGVTLSLLVEDPSENAATVSPTQAHITTETTDPTPDEAVLDIEADPKQAIFDYYAALNAGQYLTAWDSMSHGAQQRINDSDYDAYRDYWDSAPTVVVTSVEALDSFGPEATLAVGLYYSNIQQVLNFEFDLIYDFALEMWLIDGVSSAD